MGSLINRTPKIELLALLAFTVLKLIYFCHQWITFTNNSFSDQSNGPLRTRQSTFDFP